MVNDSFHDGARSHIEHFSFIGVVEKQASA